ncbi:MAG TPA: VOC family protein [Vicinamibacterales bacterium]|nr:VOC family protein [Vicinamibacterales bacterium]
MDVHLLLTVGSMAAAAALALGQHAPDAPGIDHILLGAADLDRAVAQVAEATGVQPVYGGKHPRGTHNALLALGGRTYLEIIALQPGVERLADFPDLRGVDRPVPIDWAVTGRDMTSLRDRLKTHGFQLAPAAPGSRAAPDGTTLRWESTRVENSPSQAPFFIAWSPDTPHPSTTAPAGCTLARFRIGSPDAAALKRMLSALDITAEVEETAAPEFLLALDCPKGRVTFTSGQPIKG